MYQPEDTSHREEHAVEHKVNKLLSTYIFLQTSPPFPLISILREKKLYFMYKVVLVLFSKFTSIGKIGIAFEGFKPE